ncbi:MAG: phage terminase large subunit [Oscillospiraceae bacterium]|nr:phage terminase large subunit [Oscillospiraceae bacterium]
MKTARKTADLRLTLEGIPNAKQQLFFDSRTKYTAYGGARGGGKSWALRRKMILMALRYEGFRGLIIRRSYPELRENHILPLLNELNKFAKYTDTRKSFEFPNGSRINLGYCNAETDVLQYQGQEYDVIAIDEATQLTEYQFNTLKACVRGVNDCPKRMYLTCNPGGAGHSWVKRLFVDRLFGDTENPGDYSFIQAFATDNDVLMKADPDYIKQLETLPYQLREAWLYGKWDIFEGQYFTEFNYGEHVCAPFEIDDAYKRYGAFDYGFDMLAALWIAVDYDGNCFVYREYCEPNLTLSEAAEKIAELCGDERIEYMAASPDLWNRRQDSGYSGVEIMNRVNNLPLLLKADDRRIIGWRTIREYLKTQKLKIFSTAGELIRCLPALMFDKRRPEDAANEPHAITHAPEALRYALMSRIGDN